ncbi:DUF3515 domain-containing protein [Streptomyces sp. NPDC056600]|uniref:DUF3515 domain-containing protein n=1 Tax=Streptomyces sp. NPDC056600 TaxID=3345874 RepID=UPI0036A68B57
MRSFRHRPRSRARRTRPLASAGVAGLLLLAPACSSADDRAEAAVPAPGKEVAGLCRALDEALPGTVVDEDRSDPEPQSEFTAGWGSPAIILRCGIPRPPVMSDPEQVPVDIDGVAYVMEELGDGGYRFTTALRRAYVEVTVPKEVAAESGSYPLVDLAPMIKKTVPKGVAD